MRVLRKIFAICDFVLQKVIPKLCAAMLALMVCFILYTVVMRSVFLAPPFWGDTLALFANIWMVMLAFALAVRNRSNIAMEAFYVLLPARATRLISWFWTALFGAIGLLMLIQGYEVASQILGSYWELGNMPKSYPMMILPITGFLVIVAAIITLVEPSNESERDGETATGGNSN